MNNELKRSIIGVNSEVMEAQKLVPGIGDDKRKRWSEVVGTAALETEKFAALGFGDAASTRWLDHVNSAAFAAEKSAGFNIGDEVKRSIAGMSSVAAQMGKLELIGNERWKRWSECVGAAALTTEKLAALDLGNAAGTRLLNGIGSAELATEGWAALNIDDELKRSFEQTSLLSEGISTALHRICIPAAAVGFPPSTAGAYQPLTPMEPTPNPIWETNRQLAELTETVTQLVSVERLQAELTQAICNTANIALKNSVESGEEAKTATRVARRTIVVTIMIAILSIIYTTYNNHRESVATETRHQEEMRVLRDISNQLNGLAK
jgi:hypothetical protein